MVTKHAASLVRQVNKSIFGKKHIAFGRILDHWKDIMGETLHEKTRPISVSYRKQKDKTFVAVLKIATTSSLSMQVSYQKMLILEKVNQLIDKPHFVDVVIEHETVDYKVSDNKQQKFSSVKPLSDDIQTMLQEIEDETLKKRLEQYLTSANR